MTRRPKSGKTTFHRGGGTVTVTFFSGWWRRYNAATIWAYAEDFRGSFSSKEWDRIERLQAEGE